MDGRRWRRWYAVGELGRVELLHFDEGLGGIRQMVLVLVEMMVRRHRRIVGVMWMMELAGGRLVGVAATLAAHRGCLVLRVRVAERGEPEGARVGCGRSAVVVVGRRTRFTLEHRSEE